MARKNLRRRLPSALIEGARRSDRDLAKILGVSQPTVTHRRKELEKSGIKRNTP
jgi:DNA-binding Lrp family transcriptional regulator